MSVCGRVASCGSWQATMARPGPEGNRRRGFSQGFCGGYGAWESQFRQGSKNQLFSSDLILLSNSSNEVSPLIISPLMKKVGVELTFSTSLANFWSAAILSSSAWSLRQSSTACWLRPACLPMRVSVSVVFFVTQSFCCLNSMSTTAKYLPASSLAMQRASIEPAAALTSSGNSRNTKRILPLSIYSDLIFGNTLSVKAAQCGQVIEAYSVMVTEALAGPSAMSGNDCGLATSAAPCAIACPIRRSGENPTRAASPVSDRAAVKARRVMIKVCSREL